MLKPSAKRLYSPASRERDLTALAWCHSILQSLPHLFLLLAAGQLHNYSLQVLLLEGPQAATTQAQGPPEPLALAMTHLAMAATPAQAQRAPLQPRPKATSLAQLRTKPPRAAAATMAARQIPPQATTAAATPQPRGYQALQVPLVPLVQA